MPPVEQAPHDRQPHRIGSRAGRQTGIADVAARAGVSVATVSRALRGLPNVAPSTRARVLKAADDLQYVAHPHASRLAAGRTRTIGMVVPFVSQWFFSQFVAGAESLFAVSDYDVMLYCVGGRVSRDRFFQTLPFRRRVDGVIIVGLPLGDEDERRLQGQDIPVVLAATTSTCFPTVRVDNVASAARATRHLLNLGHRSIGLITNLPDDPMHLTAPLERREGYRQVLAEERLEQRPELEVPGNFSLTGGAEAMASLLSVDRPPSAVFAESDEMAIGALRTVRDAGLSVPEDISIVGFDDHEVSAFVGLTAVAQPVVRLGEVAAEVLLEGLSPDGAARQDVVLTTKLAVRSTTGPPRQTREPAR